MQCFWWLCKLLAFLNVQRNERISILFFQAPGFFPFSSARLLNMLALKTGSIRTAEIKFCLSRRSQSRIFFLQSTNSRALFSQCCRRPINRKSFSPFDVMKKKFFDVPRCPENPWRARPSVEKDVLLRRRPGKSLIFFGLL